ncbi:MAG: sigma-54 interaction domain-containing protein [Bacteroidia bacterium]
MQQRPRQADAILKAIQEREKDHLLQLGLCTAFSKIDKRNALAQVISQLKEHIGFDAFTLCVADSSEKEYRIFFHDDPKSFGVLKNKVHIVEDGYFNTTLQSAEPMAFSLTDAVSVKKGLPAFMFHEKQHGMKEALAYPLHYHKNNPTLLYLFFKHNRGLTAAGNRLLKGLSMQLALTVSNILVTEKIALYGNTAVQSTISIQENIEENTDSFSEVIGQSDAMQKVVTLIKQVAPSDSGVLLLGESGTGKEVIATAIHKNSARSSKEMIRVNCAAIPANLIESELFGHEKGSFTGAVNRRIGKFEQADNSTLFLDEIGELPLALQTKLLRVLQEQEFERIGSTKTIKTNVRIIAATNINLQNEMTAGRFRADLFYRLNIFPITLPPLRERMEDLAGLSAHFIKQFTKTGKKPVELSSKALKVMAVYPWPGNVRELRHTLERAVLLANGSTLGEEHLPGVLTKNNTLGENQTVKTLAEVEKEHILNIIRKCNGRISGEYGAAKLLGLPHTTLISKMQKLGIQKRIKKNDL